MRLSSFKETKCDNDVNETNCLAQSFMSSCGTTKCFRIPGQSCKKNDRQAKLYGGKCASGLICDQCGECTGTIMQNGAEITYSGNCKLNLGKRNFLSNSDEDQFYPIPSPIDV